MKKSLVALAALAVAGVASAQSSVTLFGVVDASITGFRVQSQSPFGVTITKNQNTLSNSGENSSRLGFRGTEDLGGGLAASFWLEAGLNNNDGTGAASGGGLDFNRRSTVSLSGAFGEVRLGKDYTPTFWSDTVFDPFGTNGVGTNIIANASGFSSAGAITQGFQANPNYVRAINSVGYFLPPNLGGFYGQLMYAFNNNTSYDPGTLTPLPAINTRVGKYIGGRAGYATGPLDVALAYGQSTIGSNYFVGSTTTLDIWNLGASYDFGVAKLFGEYSNNKEKVDLATNTFNPLGVTQPGANGGLVGVTVPVGAGLIRASYGVIKYKNTGTAAEQFFGTQTNPSADKFSIGYVYNLSKRTSLYATFAYLKNKNGSDLTVNGGPSAFIGTIPGGVGTAIPNKSMGYDLGISHAF
jgi:predicted porin